MSDNIEIGSRVRVKEAAIERCLQPWRDRFMRGRQGTVIQAPSANVRGWMVEWDHGKVKYPWDWRLVHRSDDLEVIAPPHIESIEA